MKKKTRRRRADAQKARQLLSASGGSQFTATSVGSRVPRDRFQTPMAVAPATAPQLRGSSATFKERSVSGASDKSELKRPSQILADLQQAQTAAQNVNFAADSAINALTKTLQAVEARLKAAQAHLEAQSKQQRNAWSESPPGA